MKININRLAIALSGLILCCSGCYKDKGNYNYKSINDIAIVISDTVIANTGDTLKITPEIHQAQAANEGHLTYEWGVALNDGTGADPYAYTVLATTRNLNVLISLIPHTLPYAMYYNVKDSVTGITYKKIVKLMVTAKYQTGWMLLENNGTAADISFINTITNTTYRHVFTTANPGIALPASTNATYNFYDLHAAKTVVTYADQGYVLDYYSQKKIASYATLFSSQPATLKPQFMYNDGVSQDILAINDGKLFKQFLGRGSLQFSDQYTVKDTLGISDYYLAPTAGYSGDFAVYFDKLNHRFLHEVYEVTQLRTLNDFLPVWDVGFDPNNITDSLLAMGADNSNDIKVIMKPSGSDDCVLYVLGGPNRYYNYQKFTLAQADNPNMALSKTFVFFSKRSQCYYAYQNNLYLCSMNGWGGNTSNLVYSFPAGENIAAMNGLKVSGGFDKLVIATDKGSTSDFYQFDLNDTGDLDGGAPKYTYTGFDKIINISYKK